MKIYLFSKYNFERIIKIDASSIEKILNEVAFDTDTVDLVVTVYFVRHSKWVGGSAYVQNWLTASNFTTRRGKWKFTANFETPSDLPPQYKLIRLLFDLNITKYPLTQNDVYGWRYQYISFNDHLALLFAHELHHFRRFHLGLHPGEGEQSANKWALWRVVDLDFQVKGTKVRSVKRKSKIKKSLHHLFDPYKKFRNLPVGATLLIKYDPRGIYQGQLATTLRPVRSNARRVVIQTDDGKSWRWPMDWLYIK